MTVADKQDDQPREKNPAAVAMGKHGGPKGGKARAEKLSPERRKEIAHNAAEARWSKSEGSPGRYVPEDKPQDQ